MGEHFGAGLPVRKVPEFWRLEGRIFRLTSKSCRHTGPVSAAILRFESVLVAEWTGGGFTDPVALHSAAAFNRRPDIAFDTNDNPMVVCASAPGSTVTLETDPMDIVEAMAESDIPNGTCFFSMISLRSMEGSV